MKKLILAAAAAVLVAGLSQAATIDWGVGTQQIKDWNGTLQNGTAVQLVFIGNVGGTAGEWVYQERTSTIQTTGAGGRVSIQPISPGINIGQQVAGSGQNLTTDKSQFIIRIWNLADTAWIGTTAFTFSGKTDTDAVIWAAGSVTTAGAVNKNIQTAWGTEGNWTPVPEPTSFALIGLGAAAIALRRRFRK
jgi:opacity protein-like surface antigen